MPSDQRFNFDDEGESTEVAAPSDSRPVPKPLAVQPFIVAVLVFLSVAAFVFGGVTIIHNVTSPFQGSANAAQPSPTTLADASQAISDEQTKTMDTDGDGLSDYDEIHSYRTSPYLKDTDGDTFADKEEITSGHDPLCAAGKTCTGIELASTSTPQLPVTTPFTSLVPQASASTDPYALLEQITPAQVRALLLQKGIDPGKINQISDADLMNIYRQTLQEVKSSDPTGQSFKEQMQAQAPTQVVQPSAQPSTLPPLLSALGTNPTPDQIRAVLRGSGKLTEDQIMKFDDPTLLNLYSQALAKQQGK